MPKTVSRRHFLAGQPGSFDQDPVHFAAIASAVVAVMPCRRDDVASTLSALPHTEVSAAEGSKIVVILEGRTRGEIGERLAQIAMMEGVITANMVFEHTDGEETS
jgi:periplasmic nitrate reductase NapD